MPYARRIEDDEADAAIRWARQYIGEEKPGASPGAVTDPAQGASTRGVFDTLARNAAEIPQGVAHGSIEGINEAVDLAYMLGDKLSDLGPEWADYSLNFDFTGEGMLPSVSLDKGRPKGKPHIPQLFSAPETIAGELASGVAQFLTGFAAGGRNRL